MNQESTGTNECHLHYHLSTRKSKSTKRILAYSVQVWSCSALFYYYIYVILQYLSAVSTHFGVARKDKKQTKKTSTKYLHICHLSEVMFTNNHVRCRWEFIKKIQNVYCYLLKLTYQLESVRAMCSTEGMTWQLDQEFAQEGVHGGQQTAHFNSAGCSTVSQQCVQAWCCTLLKG